MDSNNKKYPVFIIVDDAGLPYVDPENPKSAELISIDCYHTILKLAREFDSRMCLCFVVRYLDLHDVSGTAQTLDYAEKLVDLLKDNRDHIEIGYHGLDHGLTPEYCHHRGEFYSLDTNNPVPEEIQSEHIYKSYLIFKDLGLTFPRLFVPPDHAWQEGVTDRLLSAYGVKYLASCRVLRYGKYTYKWHGSRYLSFVPRESLGIWGHDISIGVDKMGTVKRWLPRKSIENIIVNPRGYLRRIFNKPSCCYMTHIGNFMPKNFEFWREFFLYVKNNRRLYLPKDIEDACASLAR